VSQGSRGKAARRGRGPELALAVFVTAAIAGLTWLFLVYPAARRGHARGASELTVVVATDDGIDDVAEELEHLGAIDDAHLLALYARLLGADEHLRRGPVRLRADMTIRTLLARLAEGLGPTQIDILVPEGFDRYEIAARLERWDVCAADDFLRATEDRALLDELEIPGPSAEGYLFPDTYTLATGTEPAEIVRRFVRRFRSGTEDVFAEEGDARQRAPRERLRALGLRDHEVLVLASIVEQEAVAREEQPVIAGVFVNRLESDTFLPLHRLQADPTIAYGCKVEPARRSCEGFDGRRITRAMLEDESNPYNTYRLGGLPPGPICNPGLPAIRAVLHHARHDYFYFVARGGGRHVFSATLDAHNDGVADLREREREAE
jgi:UPF0755 protein